MSITDITVQQASPLAREVLFTRIRGELRIVHPRLTDRQLDQIADAIVEIRLTSARLGLVRDRNGTSLRWFGDKGARHE